MYTNVFIIEFSYKWGFNFVMTHACHLGFQMQRPSPKIAIEDYDYMKTMDEYVKWIKPTHLLSLFLQTLGPIFVHLPLLNKNLITFINVHTRGNSSKNDIFLIFGVLQNGVVSTKAV